MNKILLLLLLLPAIPAQAQPWMPHETNKPVKFKDVITNYKALPQGAGRQEDEDDKRLNDDKEKKEGKDYLFQRWAWYWQQHLDTAGYMVPPAKTMQEWNNATNSGSNKAPASRTTAAGPANWVFQGPTTTPGGYWGLGRVNVVATHPTNPAILFAGSAGGGLWKSTDSGTNWAPLYGNLPTLGVSDIVINPLNPNTIYVCTGDADGYGNFSMGVIKSTNGGATWASIGGTWLPTYYIWNRSLVMNPADTNTLILAANTGINITHDGGLTWPVASTGDFKQVIYHPADTNIVYASRYPSGGDSSSQIMRSVNGGATWATVTAFTDAQRINLAVCPSSPNIVKAIASNNSSGLKGIYGSSNRGASFTPLFENDTDCTGNMLGYEMGLPTTQCNGQGWYDLCIAISPVDSSKVIIGGVNNYYSTDGGTNWQIVTTWYSFITGVYTVHADKHHLIYNPLDGVLYQGCDGGVYKTRDPIAGPWINISNTLGITQFYRNAVANGVPWCIGGSQDNGTKMINGSTSTDLTGGDGMQCRIDYNDPVNTWYTAYQNGGMSRTTDAGASYTDIKATIPDTLDGIWITPYILHPIVSTMMLVGIDILFASNDQGSSWSAISPQFDPNSKINHIAMSPANGSYIYLTLENNKLYFSPDYGVNWDTITTAAFANNISCIAVEPKNADILWVTFNGYGTQKTGKYNRTTGTWLLYNSLPNIPVNCIVIDSFSGTRYIGTDVAVYYMDTIVNNWFLYNTNLPSVNVTDLNINYGTNEIWAATYGRGMWKTTKREMVNGISIVPYAADIINVTPNPNKGIFTITTSNKMLTGNDVTVRVIAGNGTIQWQGQLKFDTNGQLKVDAKGVPPGYYICETANDKMTARCRIIVY
ncbi:MAG: hypothetical protein H7257_13890 [Taibaiella sp.]|nr:hypothetical protein [Taibaiella sp.]